MPSFAYIQVLQRLVCIVQDRPDSPTRRSNFYGQFQDLTTLN